MKPKNAKNWVQGTFKGDAKFNPGWTDKEIIELINMALEEAKRQNRLKPTDLDGFIFDCGVVIGASKGKPTRKIKLHINKDGKGLHAFPFN